ncbi:MAG: LamG domain-containing protein [Roseibacillus sp.]
MKNKTILALLAVSAIGAQAAAIHTGLLNYWTLDGNGEDSASDFTEGTSTVEDDMTAGGAVGTTTILSTGGLFGGAVDFEVGSGVDGHLAATASADTQFAGESITVSLWAQFEDNSTGDWQSLLVNGEGNNYRISTNRNNPGRNQASAAFGTGDLNSGVDIRAAGPVSGFHHIVVTAVNGAPVNIYVNGVLEGTSGGNSAITNDDPGVPDELWIGNNVDDPDRQWDGLIDDVAQWDRALTAAEVTEIYDAGVLGISLGAIPEPTSGLLLGLGGLTVLLRRRR